MFFDLENHARIKRRIALYSRLFSLIFSDREYVFKNKKVAKGLLFLK